MKAVLLSLILFIVGCSSSYLEKGSLTEEEYIRKINTELKNENVIVNSNNKSDEGLFIRIDSKTLLISKSNEIEEISKNDILSIEYKSGSILLGSIAGTFAGFVAGLLLVKVSGATINFGGGSKNPEYFMAIPITTLVGSIWGGIEGNSYKTIEFNKNSVRTRISNK